MVNNLNQWPTSMILYNLHIAELEYDREELQTMEDYYRDHVAIMTDIGDTYKDDPEYQEEYESLKRHVRELEEPLFRLFEENRHAE